MKSKDITKYNVDWQMARVKARKTKDLEEKIKIVNDYFDAHQTIDAWERVYNWIDGTIRGYAGQNIQVKPLVQMKDAYFKYDRTKLPKEGETDSYNELKKHDFKYRLALWRDLYNRNKKWLAKGYVHQEQNEFLQTMIRLFEELDEAHAVPNIQNYYEALERAKGMKNTHKFLY